MLFNFFVIFHYSKKIEQLETTNYQLEKEITNLKKDNELLLEKQKELEKTLQNIKTNNQKLKKENDLMKKQMDDLCIGRGEMMEITAYAPLDPNAVRGWDYSGNPSITASGKKVVPGLTVAAGPEIPFGTYILIEGLGVRRVDDRGGLIGNRNIDVAVKTRREALSFGRQKRRVIILTDEKAKRLLK